jgi:hypothetical protein
MRFVESTTEQDFKKEVLETQYNKDGKIAEDKEKIVAKLVKLNENQNKYFIATHNNVPYDPSGIDSHREANLNIVLKAVTYDTFFYYLLYLQTKNSLYMTRSQRSFING